MITEPGFSEKAVYDALLARFRKVGARFPDVCPFCGTSWEKVSMNYRKELGLLTVFCPVCRFAWLFEMPLAGGA